MTLIYLLTGTHPAELPQVDGQVTFKAEISKQLERWLETMIHPHLDRRFESAKAAQLALKAKDGSYGNFDQLKPANTQIRLHRDSNRLQITWYQTDGMDLSCYGLIILLFILFLMFISFPVFTLSGCMILVFLLMIRKELSLKKNNSFPATNYHMVIDDHHIYTSKDNGQDHSSTEELSWHLRSQIGLLAYNPGYTFNKCLDSKGKLIRGNTIIIPPKLYLHCGNSEYSLPPHSSSVKFSQAELWWLGQELSDFLNLELQVISSTPQLLPQQTYRGDR